MGTKKNERMHSGDMYDLGDDELIIDPRSGSSIKGPGIVRIYLIEDASGVMVQQLLGSTKIFIDGVTDPEQVITKLADEI